MIGHCIRDQRGIFEKIDELVDHVNELEKKFGDEEDCEEPKEYWFIDFNGEVKEAEVLGFEWQGWMKEIGNYFKTKEEAWKAVEKFKIWKRLKDKGFKFTTWKNGILLDETVAGQVRYEFPIGNKDDIEKDLDLLFGGENEPRN